MCVWVIYEQLNQENGKGHEPVFFGIFSAQF